MKIYLYSVLLVSPFLFISCDSSKKSNKTEITSENTAELQNVLDISKFKPQKVKFQYTSYDNSSGFIEGPSDYFLQAELFYDKNKIDSLKSSVDKIEADSQAISTYTFFNQWFDHKTAKDVENIQDELKIYEDFLYDTNGKIILLENKILYKK
jgi:NDP-sugar pyrophosphorylase family protein